MIAQTIQAIAENWFVILFVIAIVTTLAKLRRFRADRRPVNASYVFWGEVLVYSVGIDFIIVGLLHAYFQGFTAPIIGWQPSPFEYELGWMEIPLGLVAVLALWRGFEFRLAATIVYVIFSLAAAAQHLQLLVCCGNHAPGNAGTILWFSDIFVPLLLVVLAALSQSERS